MSLNAWLGRVLTLSYVCLRQNSSLWFEKTEKALWYFFPMFRFGGVFCHRLLSCKHTAPELKISEACKFLRGNNHPTVEDTCGNI